MSIPAHDMPRQIFADLAAGGGGAGAIRELAAAQFSKHMLLLRGVIDQASTAGHDQATQARRGYDVLAAAQQHNPEAVAAVITYPSVGAWALRMARAPADDPAGAGAAAGGLRAVAAAAAIRAGWPTEITMAPPGPTVMLPSLGAAAATGGSATLRCTDTGTEISSSGQLVRLPADPHRDAPGWSALRQIRAGSLELIIDDLDPYRMPAVPKLAARLPATEVPEWAAVFRAAWELLTHDHPAIAAEVSAAIKVVVPLLRPPRGQDSSSSGETFGAIAMSQPLDALTLMVTLAHEVQHLKLCGLIDLVRLTRPDDGRRFYAPWRDDPRPASGLLQGTYAYLGVSGFWRRQREFEQGTAAVRAHAEFARWREASALAAAALAASGVLTEAGREFVRGITQTLTAWQSEPTPAEAVALARREAQQHTTAWQSRNGSLPG
jgi:HEXXH motif-containing protein